MSDAAPLPLRTCRILAISSFGAGPWATMMLADLGAEVIKIEDPKTGGDTSRVVPPLTGGIEGDSLYFQSMNRNKCSLTLDISSTEGRDLFRRLVAVSDVVYNNLRGDRPTKLGLTYEHLHTVNPRIVCVSCSGYGSDNSRASEPGYDFIIQALAGYMALTGEPGAPPTRCGVSVIDFASGLVSLVAVLAGVIRARETGKGGDAETSLFASSLSMLNYLAAWNLNTDFKPKRHASSAHQTIVPVQTFPTKDSWIYIMCMKNSFFQLLCQHLELPELAEDTRFYDISGRYENRDELVDLLSVSLRKRTTAQWVEILRGDVPCAPVNDIHDALRDPFVEEVGMLWEIDGSDFGRIHAMGCPIRLEGTEPLPRRPAPKLGADTDTILGRLLDLDADEIARLRKAQVI